MLTDCGEIFTWGRGGFGRLGHGNREAADSPRRIEALEGIPCVQVRPLVVAMWFGSVGSVRFWLCSVRFGAETVPFGSVWFDSVGRFGWLGSVGSVLFGSGSIRFRIGSVRFLLGSVRFGSVRFGSVCLFLC